MAIELPEFDICVASIPYGISSPRADREAAVRLPTGSGRRRCWCRRGQSSCPCPSSTYSSLVEIRPKQTRPKEFATGVGLDEWLAFTRVCTGQHKLQQQHQPPPKKKKKRKTLGVLFKQDEMVIELLRLAQGHAGGGSEDGGVVVAGNNEDDRDCDVGVASGFISKEEVVAFKERIAGALRSAAVAGKTASQLPNDELLRLLLLFIHRGIRFGRGVEHIKFLTQIGK
ncbi:hypothetical protein OsI_01904 [Oryza sativa Indica Group]|uniref:rRNA adenine N(6)-methyltransferase n=1 Tax=Oryza sativa subsp. indica TaxID=39946 RepID=A2WPX0_ORYSI|nr:hypothetical protein OsI_01904 [Oryza sativa Indica Group]